MGLPKTSFFIALIALSAQVQLTAANPVAITHRDACAVIPGLSNVDQRDAPFPLSTRQTTNPYVSMGTLSAQTTPCIPTTVDVSSLSNSVGRAQSDGRAHAEGLFSFLKDVWSDVTDVIKVVADVEAVLLWGDVVSLYTLAIDGYKLYTDVSKTIIDAKSLDGQHVVSFYPIFPKVVKPDPPCGYGTHKMCP